MDKKIKKSKKIKKPLGYITLRDNSKKPIYPTNDFFINYTYEKEENWMNLRTMVNIYLNAYAEKHKKQDGFHLVDENIKVKTQYMHFLNPETSQPAQDFKIDEVDSKNLTFVEIQDRTASKPPIPIRAHNYTHMAISKADEKAKISQIWFLGEVNNALHGKGKAFSNFRWKDDVSGNYYPLEVNLMFISLPRLAKEKTVCGELSRFLLGEISDVTSEVLKPIADMLKQECEIFVKNEEVIESMTIVELRSAEAREIGIEMGREEERKQSKQIISQLKERKSPEDIADDLGVSLWLVNEWKDMLGL